MVYPQRRNDLIVGSTESSPSLYKGISKRPFYFSVSIGERQIIEVATDDDRVRTLAYSVRSLVCFLRPYKVSLVKFPRIRFGLVEVFCVAVLYFFYKGFIMVA